MVVTLSWVGHQKGKGSSMIPCVPYTAAERSVQCPKLHSKVPIFPSGNSKTAATCSSKSVPAAFRRHAPRTLIVGFSSSSVEEEDDEEDEDEDDDKTHCKNCAQ